LVNDVEELVLDLIGCKLIEVVQPGEEEAEVRAPLTLAAGATTSRFTLLLVKFL